MMELERVDDSPKKEDESTPLHWEELDFERPVLPAGEEVVEYRQERGSELYWRATILPGVPHILAGELQNSFPGWKQGLCFIRGIRS